MQSITIIQEIEIRSLSGGDRHKALSDPTLGLRKKSIIKKPLLNNFYT
jgi:hypothetical protein